MSDAAGAVDSYSLAAQDRFAAELRGFGPMGILAVLASPNPIDNFEGISATRGRRGETLLWVNSNDNFNPLQRNLLLLFELGP